MSSESYFRGHMQRLRFRWSSLGWEDDLAVIYKEKKLSELEEVFRELIQMEDEIEDLCEKAQREISK